MGKLLEEILSTSNLDKAHKKAKSNKGAPGIDGVTVDDLHKYLTKNKDILINKIRERKYKPAPVKRVEIPKPDGGKRKLGIPTVFDRVIQQAIT